MITSNTVEKIIPNNKLKDNILKNYHYQIISIIKEKSWYFAIICHKLSNQQKSKRKKLNIIKFIVNNNFWGLFNINISLSPHIIQLYGKQIENTNPISDFGHRKVEITQIIHK